MLYENGPRLSEMHREEIRRQVRALRGPKRPAGAPGGGRVATFLRELRTDLVRLAGTFGPSPGGRKKGAM